MSTPTTLELTRTPPQMLAHIAEECAEFLKAYAKYQRFGMWPVSLGIQYDNLADMELEIADIMLAIKRWRAYSKAATRELKENDFK